MCVFVYVRIHAIVFCCRLSRQHSDLGTSLLDKLLQVDLSQLFSQLLQLLLLLLPQKNKEDNDN